MIGGKRISGFVITYNEEANIRDCLESMKWVDELVVVDSFSEDATVEIARAYTDKVIQREFGGYTAQTRFAFEQTTCEWVLWLDADERLTDEAFAEVRQSFEQAGGPGCDGFAFPRKTYFLDRWITHGHWYPEHKLRLVRREVSTIGGDAVTPVAIVQGRAKKLRGEILHYSYPGGVVDYVRRSAAYADRWARGQFAAGRRCSRISIVLKPPFAFLKSYLLKLGMLEGIPGLAIAVGTAYYKFIREMKLWEMAHAREPAALQAPEMSEDR